MPQLILMRHAKSSWDDLSLDDHDRPLNPRGRASAKAMGDWLRAGGYCPDTIVSSTSERTRETCAYLGLSAAPTFLRSLYHASADQILATLRDSQGETVLLLGHNPGIGECAERIVDAAYPHPRFSDFPTCATLVASLPAWDTLRWGDAAAVDFAIPRDVMNAK